MARTERLHWLVLEARENLNDVKRLGECHFSHELSDFTHEELTCLAHEAAKTAMCIVIKCRQETNSVYFQFVDQKETPPA